MPLPTPTEAMPAVPLPANSPVEPTPQEVDQAAVFLRLRGTLIRNTLQVALASGRVRLFTMLGTSSLVALFVFGLSFYALSQLFIYKIPATGLIVGGIFDMMFFTLGGMLLFSTGIILYASLFTSPEARFLLTTPARADRIFSVKFQDAVLFSSWAFMVLGLPILIAFGIQTSVPWYYYPLLPLYLLGFVLLPGSFSAVFCLLLVRFLPTNRRQALLLLGLLVVGIAGTWLVRVGLEANRTMTSGDKNDVEVLVARFTWLRSPLAPSHWVTMGILAAARGETRDAFVPLALLWSNGLMAYLVAAVIASRTYRVAFDRISGQGRSRKIYRSSVLDRVMNGLVFYLDRPTRVLIVKDFRTFRRDPTQWVLLIIFGGMMILTALNLRSYYKNDLPAIDKYAVSLINFCGLSVLMCAGLSRFIFPLISLEGRKFWILGLMPINRRQILIGKFAFAATGTTLISEIMMVTSDTLLGMSWEVILAHACAALVVALGLSAINVGLGAVMPNFRENDPSKIVVGFGGTVNMVISLGYMLIVIIVMLGALHTFGLKYSLQGNKNADLPGWAFLGIPFGLVLGAIAVILPLRMGTRSLEKTEF